MAITNVQLANTKNVQFDKNVTTQKKDTKVQLNEFKDTFTQDMKKTMPASLILAGVFSLFEMRKKPNDFMSTVISNVAVFASINATFSAVQSIFKVKANNKNAPQ